MKKNYLSLLVALMSTSSVFAATEPAWYNDVKSCTAGMQVYIYTPNGKGFVQENAAKCLKATTSATPAMWTISKQDDGTIKSTNGYYLRAYQTNSNTTSKSTDDGSEKICVTSMKSGAYWNIHGHYKYLAMTYYAALYYNNGYEATCNMLGNKVTQEDSQYQFYFISADQYTRHWTIYEFDSYKESFTLTDYSGNIPSAMYSALSAAYNTTLDVQSNNTNECQTALTNLQQIKEEADKAISVYASTWEKINALDAITDRGEDPTVVNKAIADAKTNVELATTTNDIQAIGDGLKTIDPITFDSTTYNALTSIVGCASSANKQQLTYASSNLSVVNSDMLALHKGVTTITAKVVESETYYPFVRSAQITVLAVNNAYNYNATICDNESYSDENFKNKTTSGQYNLTLENRTGGDSLITLTLAVNPTYFFQESKTMWFGKDSVWHSKNLSKFEVGTHTVCDSMKTTVGCDSVYVLTLVVKALPTTYGKDSAYVCPNDSAEFRGKRYPVGEYKDTLKNWLLGDSIVTYTVKALPTYFFPETKAIFVGKDSLWRGKNLSEYAVGQHVIYDSLKTVAECDSVYQLTLTVNALPTTTGVDSAYVCPGDSVLYQEHYYVAGVYNVTIQNYLGGDSIVTFTVKEWPVYQQTVQLNAVYGDTILYHNETRTYVADTVGVVMIDTVYEKTINGCDSILYFEVTVSKALQLIVWNDSLSQDTVYLTMGDSILNLATSTQGLSLLYRFDNQEQTAVVIVENTLYALSEATVTVTPYQEGTQFIEAAEGQEKTFVIQGTATTLRNSNVSAECRKMLVNGQLIILNNSRTYNAQGTAIR